MPVPMPAQTRGVGLRPRERKAKASVKREGQDDFWIAIGGAWMHRDGDGYNVILQALPIDGKIVLHPPKVDTKSPEVQALSRQFATKTTGAKALAARSSNRRCANTTQTGFCQAHLQLCRRPRFGEAGIPAL